MSEGIAATVLRILGHQEFADAIVAALGASVPAGCPAANYEEACKTAFNAMIQRVAVAMRRHPGRHLLLQLMRDYSKISDNDVIDLFEFIYSYVVNHFKGELAELLARPSINKFMTHLLASKSAPLGVEIVAGYEIKAKRLRDGIVQAGWYESADALLVVRHDHVGVGEGSAEATTLSSSHIVVVAAVEVKSYRKNLRDVFTQLARHVRRLRFGFRLHEKELDPEQVAFLVAARGNRMRHVHATSRLPASKFARLAIRPKPRRRPAKTLERWGPQTWVAELPFSAVDISEASYLFTDWLLSQAGAEVFRQAGEDDTAAGIERIPNPWPEKTPVEAASNRLREAMYYTGRREVLTDGHLYRSRRYQRARTTFKWLYNALCYGYAGASGDQMQWPEDRPDLPGARLAHISTPGDESPAETEKNDQRVRALLYKVHTAYGAWNLGRAQRLLDAVKRRDLFPAQARDVAWLEGMIACRQSRFSDALAVFPNPIPGKHDHWWTRDQVMLARLHARAGNGAHAREILATLEPLSQWIHNRALPTEVHGVASLSWLMDHDQHKAVRELEEGLQILEMLRAEFLLHEQRHWDEPLNVHVGTIHWALLDSTAVMASLGRTQEAIDWLSRLSGLDGWEFDYIARDPLCVPLYADPKARRQLARWKTKNTASRVQKS